MIVSYKQVELNKTYKILEYPLSVSCQGEILDLKPGDHFFVVELEPKNQYCNQLKVLHIESGKVASVVILSKTYELLEE